MKKIILPIIFLGLLLGISLWLGKSIKPDLSSNYDERECRDFGEGKGCW